MKIHLARLALLLCCAPTSLADDDLGDKRRRMGPATINPVDPRTYGEDVLRLHEQLSRDALQRIAEEHASEFAHANPFPHVVIDDLFPRDFVRKFCAE